MMAARTLPFTAGHLLSVSKKYLGVKESPPKSNRTIHGANYAKFTKGGSNGVAWCGQRVWDIFRVAGIDLQKDLGFRWCQFTPTFSEDCRRAGWAKVDPKNIRPGDVIFYDFKDGYRDGKPQHCGIAVSTTKSGWFYADEGNTSSGSKGSQSNGDGAYKRRRRTSDVIAAWRPPYATGAPATPAAPARRTITAVAVGSAILYGGYTFLPTTGPHAPKPVVKTVTVTVTQRVERATPVPAPTLSPKPVTTVPRPTSTVRYVTVQPGQTLTGVAKQVGVPYWKIAWANKLTAPYVLHPGQRLRVQ